MTTAFAQYQPLYKTIPNNINAKNQEAESSSTGILIIEKVSIRHTQTYHNCFFLGFTHSSFVFA
jgi:hypothetical protein